jgi:hypothetical protein
VNGFCEDTGKRQYASKPTAESELRRLRRHGAKGGKRLVRAYRCDCGWWHVTAEHDHW